MSRWYVKDLAEITGVSVQTLHHYDHIGLLKPSEHSAKGYRIYNENDVLKLQQIIALKFFGFELKQIKTLLAGNVSVREHFLAQARFLEAKAKALLDTSIALNKILKEVDEASSLPWSSIINLIGVYRMTEVLENSWVRDILTHEELKQYVQFEEGLKKRFSEKEKKKFHEQWASLVSEIEKALNEDPKAQASMALAERVMKHINHLYGDEHANLRHVIWEKGFKQGHSHQHAMSPEMVKWLDSALYAHYSTRIYDLLKVTDLETIVDEWRALMNEMFAGHSDIETDAINKLLLSDDVNVAAKQWLKKKYRGA